MLRGLSTINLWADDLPAATHRDGTVSVAWWLRDENGEWQPWMNKHTSQRPVPHPRRRRAVAGVIATRPALHGTGSMNGR